MSNPTWGTIPEAADRLQVSTRTIRRMITRGEIPARRIGARMIRVDLTAPRVLPPHFRDILHRELLDRLSTVGVEQIDPALFRHPHINIIP